MPNHSNQEDTFALREGLNGALLEGMVKLSKRFVVERARQRKADSLGL